MSDDAPMNVMIWSDVACPFCNVARERASWLAQNANVVVEWLPFHLHPEYPPEGIDRQELMQRFPAGADGTARRMNEEAGLVYNPHPERVPNTRRALELIEWARGQGAHEAMHERVMDAYWVEGRDIGDWDELAPLVTDVGLDPEEARTAVELGRLRAGGRRLHRDRAASRHLRRAGLRAGRPPAGERRAAPRGVHQGSRGGRRHAGEGWRPHALRAPEPGAPALRPRRRCGRNGVRGRGQDDRVP